MHERKEPGRRILLSATGMSPAVVTETVYALAVEQEPPEPPTEIHLVTTVAGKQNAGPLGRELANLCKDYGLAPIRLPPEHIHVVGGGEPLPDIRSAAENERAADDIAELVREFTSDDEATLHVSIAGGRKTMGYYAGYALSLFGRVRDRLSHVLVSPPYETLRDFYYPTPERRLLAEANGTRHDASKAEVTLAFIPFVRLRDGLPRTLLDGEQRFSEVVSIAQRTLGPPRLAIDLAGRRIRADDEVVELSARHVAFLGWIAERELTSGRPCCPADGAPEETYRDEFLTVERRVVGEMDRTAEEAMEAGMEEGFFRQTLSRLNKALETKLAPALGDRRAKTYRVRPFGAKPYAYGLEIDHDCIRFEPIDRQR